MIMNIFNWISLMSSLWALATFKSIVSALVSKPIPTLLILLNRKCPSLSYNPFFAWSSPISGPIQFIYYDSAPRDTIYKPIGVIVMLPYNLLMIYQNNRLKTIFWAQTDQVPWCSLAFQCDYINKTSKIIVTQGRLDIALRR